MSENETGERTLDLINPSHCQCHFYTRLDALWQAIAGVLEGPHKQPSVQASRGRAERRERERNTLPMDTGEMCIAYGVFVSEHANSRLARTLRGASVAQHLAVRAVLL